MDSRRTQRPAELMAPKHGRYPNVFARARLAFAPGSRNSIPFVPTSKSALWAGRAILGAIAATLIFLSLEITEGFSTSNAQSTVVLALVVVCFIGFTISVLDSRRGFLDLLVWYFFLFAMSWPGYLHASAGMYPWGPISDYSNTAYAVLVTLAFLIAYYIGYLKPAKPKSLKLLAPSIELYLCLFFCALSSLLLAVYVGFDTLFVSRSLLEELYDDKAFAYPYLLGKAFAMVGFSFSANLAWQQAAGRKKAGAWIFFAVFSVLVLVWFNPIANPRFQMLAVIVCFTAVLTRKIGPVGKSLIGGGFFIVSLFVLGPIKSLGAGEPVELLDYEGMRAYLMGVDFDTFQWMIESVVYVAQNGYLYGENLLGAVLFFVPRPLWPGKPVHSGEVVSLATGYWYSNVSSPLPAEFYLAGGLLGVVLGGFAVGRVVGRLDADSRLAARFDTVSYQTVLASLAAGYAIILLRGALGAVVPLLGLAFVFYWLIFMVSARRSRPNRSLDPG